MDNTTFHFCWEFRLQASPTEFWPYIANTDHLNGHVGQPAVDDRPGSRVTLKNGRRLLQFALPGAPIQWEEEPFEWIYPHRWSVMRRYSRGPMLAMQVMVEIQAAPAGGSHLLYHVWATPSGLPGRVCIPVYIGMIAARRVAALVERYDMLAAQHTPPHTIPGDVRFASEGQARLRRLQDQLLADGAPPDLLERLIETISQTDELLVSQLRPYELADNWGANRRAVLELCLRATRAGLLDFQWELLCPLCRNSNASSETLAGINPTVHCASCNIDYTVNFDRSVELTFRPNPSVRLVEDYEYCVGGPYRTPHIVAQQILTAGEQFTTNLLLQEGRYRFRLLNRTGNQYLTVQTGGPAEICLSPDEETFSQDELLLAPQPTLHFVNTSDEEQIFILERTAWSDQSVTAAEVTALQVFRSLFSSEALRPGERISVGRITIVFTDLRGSTRLYREIGDAPAFGRVMNHFDVLRDAIAAEGGGLVKTIGDAVMAVFSRPVEALRAMLHAQQVLSNPPEGMLPLLLKAGIHTGPCIAVTLNERLDYFGSTINIAARLEGISSGQDVVITRDVYSDPEVEALLMEEAARLQAEPFTQTLKGFDTDVFELWHVLSRL